MLTSKKAAMGAKSIDLNEIENPSPARIVPQEKAKNKVDTEIRTNFTVALEDNYFTAAAQQKISFGEALRELVNNSLMNAAGNAGMVLVSIDTIDTEEAGEPLYRLTVADWGQGMNENALINALQFGSAHRSESYLSIYGVGLCNALLGLSKHKYAWLIASHPARAADPTTYQVVRGPFRKRMRRTSECLEDLPVCEIVNRKSLAKEGAPSTIVSVVTDKNMLSTLLSAKGNTAPSKVSSMGVVRRAMVEMLGAAYQDALKCGARILVPNAICEGKTQEGEDLFVPPITPSYKKKLSVSFSVSFDGYVIPIEIEYGALDKTRLKTAVLGKPAKLFYANTLDTQGFDIVLGKYMICHGQMENVVGHKAHPAQNAFVGRIKIDPDEIALPFMPRGFIPTAANKSDIDACAPIWQVIMETVRAHMEVTACDIAPDAKTCVIKSMEEALKALYPTHEVATSYPVYGGRTKIDLLDNHDGTCEFYYCTRGKATEKDAAMLILQWNGLVSQGIQPKAAYLLCAECGPMLKHLFQEWNGLSQMTPRNGAGRLSEVPPMCIRVQVNPALAN